MNANLFARLAPALDRDRPVLHWQGATLSGRALARRAGQMAAHLAALGLGPGDRVAVQVEKAPDTVALYLGALRLGAIYLPLNTAYTLSELDYFLGDAEPRVVVCDPARAADIAPLARRIGAAVTTLDPRGGTLAKGPTPPRRSTPSPKTHPTTSPRSSTPPAPPAGRRARC
jgi:malonyl-CoA/methylmalonyl-CoA synthetase